MKRFVNLNEVTVKEPLRLETKITQRILDLPAEDFEGATPFWVRLFIRRLAIGFEVSGKISGRVTLRCSRCDEPYEEKIERDFTFQLVPTSQITDGQIKHGELDRKFSDEQFLDVAEVVREQILLSVPMKPLCGRESCKRVSFVEWGDEKDQRWSKLKELRDKLLRKERKDGSSKEESL